MALVINLFINELEGNAKDVSSDQQIFYQWFLFPVHLRCSIVLVLYMSSSSWLLRVKSRDFSQAEEERTACKAEQIHKLKTIFTQNGHRLSF